MIHFKLFCDSLSSIMCRTYILSVINMQFSFICDVQVLVMFLIYLSVFTGNTVLRYSQNELKQTQHCFLLLYSHINVLFANSYQLMTCSLSAGKH